MQMEEIISTAGRHTKGLTDQNNSGCKKDGVKFSGDSLESIRLDEVELSEAGRNMADFEKTMESLKQYAGWGNFNIGFATDDQTGSMIIKVIDRDTGEILRQIPPDQILSLRSHLQDVLGLVFDHLA